MELSFTRYRIYRECPWKYKLIFVDGRRIPPTAKSSFGLSIHRALEDWLSSGDDSEEALSAALRAAWRRDGYADEDEESRWRLKAERALHRQREVELSRRSRVVALEKEFVWELGAHTVRGMIDRVDQGPDGAYELIDYKTGPSVPTPAQVAADAQLRFYALGARSALGFSPATLTVDCVVAGARVSAAYDPSGEAALRADAAAAADAAAGGVFLPNASFCPRCDFRRDCAYSAVK